MERKKYQHPIYSDLRIESFPPLFIADSTHEVLEFESQATTIIEQAVKESTENLKGILTLLFRLQQHPRINKLIRGGGRYNPIQYPYFCFIGIKEVNHWPINDPQENTKITLSDLGQRFKILAEQPTFSDILVSPFSEAGSNFSWEAVREVSWQCAVGLECRYTKRQDETKARYTLVYIREVDKINKGGRRRPLSIVTKRKPLIAPVEI